MGFPGGLAGKESACSEADLDSIAGLGRSPAGEHGNPLQYSSRRNHGQRSLAGCSPSGSQSPHGRSNGAQHRQCDCTGKVGQHFRKSCGSDVCVRVCCRVQIFVTPWSVAHEAPLSMKFPRQEHWSGLPFLSPSNLPDPGVEPASPALGGRFFTTEPKP